MPSTILIIDGRRQALDTNHAMLALFKHFSLKGLSPRDVLEKKAGGKGRPWLSMPGSLTAIEFRAAAREAGGPRGGPFLEEHWFCDEGQLIHADDHTWAIIKNWKHATAKKCFEEIKKGMPPSGVSMFFPSSK